MKTLTALVFCFALAVASAFPGGVAIVPASAHAAISAGVLPGSVVVGPAGVGVLGLNHLGLNHLGLVGGLGWAGALAAHEGQYIPDNTELLYDDGSYRLEHHLAHN